MSDWYTDDFKFIRQSDDAICVEDGDENQVWLPKSAIDWDSADVFVDSGEIFQVSMPQWLAEQKGLI